MIFSLATHKRRLLALCLTFCLMAYGTVTLMHQAHHALAGDIAECVLGSIAPELDKAPGASPLAINTNHSTSTPNLSKNQPVIKQLITFYTSRAPPQTSA